MFYYVIFMAAMMLYSIDPSACGTEQELRALINATLNSTSYSSRVRPIDDTGVPLNLQVDTYLVALNDVDEVEQKITSTAYMTVVWSDSFMTWTPAEYGNIDKITLPQNAIWKPDLALANAYDTITGLGDSFMQIVIDENGTITWIPYQVFQSTCSLDMTFFPFDSQVCELRLVTWSSDITMIRITTGSVGFDISGFEKNANWDLERVSTEDTSTSTTSGLSFKLFIKRKPIYYLINFIIPIVLLTLLNVLVFVLPCDSGEKASYAIILFLSFAIFLLIVTEIMPEGMNTIPVMSMYLLLECVLSTLIVVAVILQLRLHNMSEDTAIPRWLKSVTYFIQSMKSRCACCRKKKKPDEDSDSEGHQETVVKVPLDAARKGRNKREEPVVMNAKTKPDINRTDSIRSEGAGDKIKRSNSATKLKEYFNPRKISPDVVFRKPDVISTPYDNAVEMRDKDDGAFMTADEDLPVTKKDAPIVEPFRPIRLFATKKGADLDSSIDSSDGTSEPEELAWSDVSSALDFFFFFIFFIINTLATFVAFIYATSG